MSRASRGLGSEEDVGWGAGCAAAAVGWLDAVVWVFGTVWEVLVETAGTPFVCGWLEAMMRPDRRCCLGEAVDTAGFGARPL